MSRCFFKIVFTLALIFTSFTTLAQQLDYPQRGQVLMHVYDYYGYMDLEMWNNSDYEVTCQGQVTWRYRNSTSESYAGVWVYLRPNERYNQNISTSPYLQVSYARPDIRCH